MINRAEIQGIDVMTPSQPSSQTDQLAAEQQAIAQLKQGDIAGLAELVQIYQAEAVHAALLIVRDQGQAEEVVQEAFVRAYRKIGQFDERRRFAPWFLRIVINAAIKTASANNRMEPLDEPQGGDRAVEWLIDPHSGPPEIAEKAELNEAVWRALGQLSPHQRAVVVMRYFLDESEAEMGRGLQRPGSTIKWWLYDARQRLKRMLRPFHEEHDEEVGHEQQ